VAWRLPPLSALRAFAAAGRLQNFSAAAKELCVTVGAISRKIKQLEDHVGVTLFVRANHDVLLTPQGRSYHTTICALLNRIEAGSHRLEGSARTRPLSLLCPTALLLHWLLPRLRSYYLTYPEQQLRINTTLSPLYNLPNSSELDISFQLASGPTPGWVCHPILSGRLALVCSPSLIAPRKQVDTLRGLLHHPFLVSSLRSTTGPDGAALFAGGLSPGELEAVRQVEFPTLGLAVAAAVKAQGLAVVPIELVRQELDRGELIQLLSRTVYTGYQYYMVYSPASARDNRVLAFREWLLTQIQGNETDERTTR